MTNKKLLFYALIVFVFAGCETKVQHNHSTEFKIPVPTEVVQNMDDEAAYETKKHNWLELIHQTAPEEDWKTINKQNFKQIAKYKNQLNNQKVVEQFANGHIEGEWFERGSDNQAGNLMRVDFEKNSELIYGVSASGSLWKSDLSGSNWQPLNNNIAFDNKLIKVIELAAGQRRIFAANGKQLEYSDDEGITWQLSSGFNNDQGKPVNLIQLNDVNQTLLYLYYDSSLPGNVLASSDDNGQSFTVVQYLSSASSNGNKAFLSGFEEGTIAYLLDGSNDLYQYDSGALTIINSGVGLSGITDIKLVSSVTVTDTTLYILKNKTALYQSNDAGQNFSLVGNLPVNSWGVGIEVAEDDPNAVYFGEVELYWSSDGGQTFNHNNWGDYYGDVVNNVHADIMDLKSFKKSDGTEFCLIANHGGVSISYDHMQTTTNIGLSNLNIGQFYDVITHPTNQTNIYGGTQDQGLQYINNSSGTGIFSMTQAISGDYGHMQISNNGNALWAQYPGAYFYVFTNLLSSPGYGGTFDVGGLDMPAYDWIVPTASAPNISDNYIYVAGGDINGGTGSHVIKLTYGGFGTFNSSQFDFDFKTSGGLISAINESKVDEDRIYVGTDNGKFYYSNDGGNTFNAASIQNGPGVLYLYGATIASANQTSDLVFFGGSGYSNNGCFMSTDGGQNFEAITNGLPPTIIHDLVLSPDDQFLFAATDAGPYVYHLFSDEWFYLGGNSAPIVEYYSVDYVTDYDIVRFGTHGRGIWDLNILSTSANLIENEYANWSIYPNPVSNGYVTIEAHEPMLAGARFELFDVNGKLVFSSGLTASKSSKFKLPTHLNGVFIATITSNGEQLYNQRLVIEKN
ncbi:MAG: T9SS type A sorting domain-containing protein [Putridiphycobacter sp.]